MTLMLPTFNTMHTVHQADRALVEWLAPSEHDAIVAGGAALRWYQGMPVDTADIDIFFKTQSGYASMFKKIQALQECDVIVSVFSPLPQKKQEVFAKLVFSTDSAETYEIHYKGVSTKVQLIKVKFFQDTHMLLNEFDISVCQVATDGHKWVVGEHFIQDLKDRKLRITHMNPVTLKRVMKYWTYGYTPSDETINNIMNNTIVKWKLDNNDNGDYNAF